MKTRIQLALVACLLSVGAHLYLALHYYPLKFGFAAGQSLCNVSAKFNCDAVSASAYSAFLGIPLAIWGAVLNAVLFVLILLSWLEWSDTPERLRRWALALSGVSAAASVIMAVISLILMHNYCIFCIALYALSFAIFFLFRKALREPFWPHFRSDLPLLWGESRGIVMAFAAIPVLAFFLNQIFLQNLGSSQVNRVVKEAAQSWEHGPKYDFVAKPALVKGPNPQSAVMTLVEFADFRCHHCKNASYSLNAFISAHPDVRFEFYNFPLDGACNDKIEVSSGMSCRLSATVHCAEKQGRGWEVHEAVFAKQEAINRLANTAELDVLLSKEVSKFGLNWESIQNCITDPSTMDAIRAQAKQGALVNVQGTPSLFANGKPLTHGQLVPVLQAVRQKLVESVQR